MRRNLRKRLFIDSNVQGALLRRCVLHWVFFSAAMLTLLVLLQASFLMPHFLAVGPDGYRPDFLSNMWSQNGLILVAMVMLLPILLYDLIKLSHRFAGPISLLRNEMRRATRGEKVKPIRFREDDFWQEMADEFNALLDRFEKQAKSHESSSEESSGANVAELQSSKSGYDDARNT